MTIKQQVSRHQKMQLEQVTYLNGMYEARQARVSNLAFRRHVLEQQKVHNYQNEYNRLRNHLENSSMPYQTRTAVQSRTEHLKTLGAKATGGIK